MIPGEPGPIVPLFHTGDTRAAPPSSHPKKENFNDFTVPAAGHPSHHPSNWWPWRTRSTGLTSSRREVLHEERYRNNLCFVHVKSFNPPSSLSLLKLANQLHRTQVIRWKSATDHLTALSEERPLRLTIISLGKHLMVTQLDGLSKPKPSPRNHTGHPPAQQQVHRLPEGTRRTTTTKTDLSTAFQAFIQLDNSSKLELPR